MALRFFPVAPGSSDNDCLTNLIDTNTRDDEDGYTRNSETRPSGRPADHDDEEQTEQQNQPQRNHSQREAEGIRIVTWKRIDFAGWSFSQLLLIGCLVVLASRWSPSSLVTPILWICLPVDRFTDFFLWHHLVYSFRTNSFIIRCVSRGVY